VSFGDTGMAIVIKVENSKADTLFRRGVIRPNFILDVKADRKVGN
jgi:hypothetical protein